MLPSTYTWSPGDTVHLVNRGVHKDPIFRDSDDCNYFLHLMSRMRKKGQCEIEAYVLLYNHFHILAKTGDVPILSTASQATCSRQNATPASSEPTPNS